MGESTTAGSLKQAALSLKLLMAGRSLLNAGLLNMKHFIYWLIFLVIIQLGLVLPTMLAADQNKALSLDEVLQNLKTRQETLTTFVADFQQVQHNQLFAEPQISAGILYFDRVGKLLMKVQQPEPYVVLLTDGKIISGTHESLTPPKNLPGGKAFLQKILEMGQSLDQLKKQFRILMNHTHGGHLYELELKPLKINHRMPYSKIQTVIDSRLWLPVNLQLMEPSGDSVRFAFQFSAINSPLPEKIFNIAPMDTHSTASDDIHESE